MHEIVLGSSHNLTCFQIFHDFRALLHLRTYLQVFNLTMSDPVTYSFYGTTLPVLRNIAATAISILTSAKSELSGGAELPSEQELLDSHLGDMYAFRMQPILVTRFSLSALENLGLNGSTPIPALSPEFSSLDDVIELFKQVQAVYDAVDEKAYNDSAEKSLDVSLGPGRPTLHMTGLADYFHGFVIPNSYFHLNAMYMLLRSKGFKLGKGIYIGSWMSEQQKKDWEPVTGRV